MATKKKDLQEPDEFLEALRGAYKYILENIKFISVIAGGIVAGAVIIVFVFYQIRLNAVKEAALMNQAVAAYHAGKPDEALRALAGFSAKGGFAGAEAALYQGNILYDQGKYEEALQQFQRARDLCEDPSLSRVRGLALQGIAYSELALNRPDKAEETLQQMAEIFEDLSLLERGRLALQRGDKGAAARLLDKLINEFPDSPWLPAAQRLKE